MQRSTPSIACSANKRSFGASAGVKGRSAANGNRAAGPKTWQCASHAPGGSLNDGWRGEGWNEGLGCKFGMDETAWAVDPAELPGRHLTLKANARTSAHQAKYWKPRHTGMAAGGVTWAS